MATAVRSLLPAAGGLLFGQQYYTNPNFNALVTSLIPNSLAGLKYDVVVPAAAGVATTVVAKIDDTHTAALAASVRAMEAMLRANRSGRSWGLYLLLATPVGVALAIRHFGWAHLGWATPEQLQARLAEVREAVLARVHALGEAMHARFGRVDEMLGETNRSVQTMRGEVKDDLKAVDANVSALGDRIAPMEANVARTAQGVDLLCEVVASLSDTSPELQRRLDDYTGAERRETLGAPPALMAPVPPKISSPFVRAILTQQPVASQ